MIGCNEVVALDHYLDQSLKNTTGKNPANTSRDNDVVITSQRRHFDVITSKWRRFDVITTLLLRHVFSGKSQITSTTYDIHPEMKLTMSLKELLSSSKNKHDLPESGPMSLICRFISLLGTLLMIDT